MNNRLFFYILIVIIFTGCSNVNNQETQQQIKHNDSQRITNVSEEDIVSAAIFKELFNNNASAFQKNVSVFCISKTINHASKDPSKALISLLSSNIPKVLPASKCKNKSGEVVDQFDQRAIAFQISNLKKNTKESYEAQAGYYEGNLSSQTNTYTARKINDKWIVNLTEVGPVS